MALVGYAKDAIIAAKKGSASILLALSGILPDSFGRHAFDVRAPFTNRDRSFISDSFFAAA